MTDKMDIEISEFLDGELDESSLSGFIKRYGDSDVMKRKLARFAIARDCVRRVRSEAVAPDLADRVMDALANEPVVLAPKRPAAFGGEKAARFLKPAAGLAVAATVATMAVLGLRGGDSAVDTQPTSPQTRMSEQQLAAESPARSTPRTPNIQYADAQMRTPVAETASASDRAWLNDYLLRHNEATGFVGRSGFMPYVHIVTTEPSRSGQAEGDMRVRRVPVSSQPE